MKPRIGLLMGDPAGIGPELVIKLLDRPELMNRAKVVVIGDHKVYQMAGAGQG